MKTNINDNNIDNNVYYKLKALFVSVYILIINFLLRITIYLSTFLQKNFSNTDFYESYIVNYVLLVFFNCALMPYMIISLNSGKQMAWNIHLIILGNAFSTPFVKIFDVVWFYKIFYRF